MFSFCSPDTEIAKNSSRLPGQCVCPGHAINVNVPVVPVAAANVLMQHAREAQLPHQHNNTVYGLSWQIYRQTACLNSPMKKNDGTAATP
jgi:hypothetical protein